MAKSSQSKNNVTDAAQAKKTASCGGWSSPINAAMVAAGALRLSQPVYDPACSEKGGALYFLEGRPSEGGRQVLVRSWTGLPLQDISGKEGSVRSLVHEYGGGAFTVDQGIVFYCNYADQRVYVALADDCGATDRAIALSPEGHYRFADFFVDRSRQRLLAVMEDHSPVKDGTATEPVNSIVAFDYAPAARLLQASSDETGPADLKPLRPTPPVHIAGGYDFYACPRVSPDGKNLVYICWDHPNLPWDDSQLILTPLDQSGLPLDRKVVAGGDDCSVFQPTWGKDGRLYFVSDKSGYWSLYGISDFVSLRAQPLVPEDFVSFEFGLPMWVFGQSTYVVVNDKLIICALNQRGLWSLARLDIDWVEGAHKLSLIDSPYSDFAYLNLGPGKIAMLAASSKSPSAIVEYDLEKDSFEVVKKSAEVVPAAGYLASPKVIEFPTENNLTAFAFYYPPTNQDYACAGNDLPPLLVKCHGGPTGSASSALSLGLQYWTSRGFAVVDVNYGGSTGYGRAYRKRLNGNWGIVDVDDCVNVVKYLVKKGLADPRYVAITGGSAGGYTVLCALTFKDAFSAGASHYGIGDLEALVRDTHKFEARYLDNLIWPYPEGKDIYVERSPINHIEKLKCPVIFFQGLEDKVVPPNQAEAMVEALNAKSIPVAYIAYEGEQHGFRQAANIICTLESELYFFRRIFGIESDEPARTVTIHNLSNM